MRKRDKRKDVSQGMQLVRYDALRKDLEAATRIDEVKEIKDKAAALEAYARQRHDAQMEAWLSEIKVRAGIRIGELSRELETGAGRPSKIIPSVGKNLKATALKQAGIGKNAAYRYEALAEIMEEKGEELQ